MHYAIPDGANAAKGGSRVRAVWRREDGTWFVENERAPPKLGCPLFMSFLFIMHTAEGAGRHIALPEE